MRSGPIVFVVVVVGGLGSLPGALIASMLIGILQTFAVARRLFAARRCCARWACRGRARLAVLRALRRSSSRTAAPILPYLLLVLMLIVRPRGLLGTRDA